MGVILKENNLIYTRQRHEKFLGSSQWRYDSVNNCLIKKVRDFEKDKTSESDKLVSTSELSEVEQTGIVQFFRTCAYQAIEAQLSKSLESAKLKKEVYTLNKKKVREKCSAFFGLKSSRKFLAFYTYSFPLGMDDDSIMTCFNTYLTRCRKDMRLRSYLWVSERQSNGTLHFHMLTNNFMDIRRANRYMAKAIDNQIKKKNIQTEGIEYTDKYGNKKLSLKFDVKRYNGVDVKRCNNNKKALNQYLTKYVSKNEIQFFRLPYHSSRDISQLFTAETFRSEYCSEFSHIRNVLSHITTYVVDNEYGSVEYLCQKQENGKFFNPPDEWYWLRDLFNEYIYTNYHQYNFDKLPLQKYRINELPNNKAVQPS